MTTQLVRFDAMKAAVAACYDVDEITEIRNKAVALEAYFRVAKDPQPERQACEVRIRAERKAGQLLREMEKAKAPPGPGRGNKTPSDDTRPFSETKTLKDLGISYDQSSKWQQLAGCDL